MVKEKKQIEYINHGTDEQMEIYGFKKSIPGIIATWIFIVLTIGFLRLIFYWKPNWMLLCTHKKCDLAEATSILLRDKYQQWFVEKVEILVKQNSENVYNNDDSDSLDQSRASRNSFQRSYSLSKKTFGKQLPDQIIKMFVNKKWKYVWSDENQAYERLRGLDEDVSIHYFPRCRGLTLQEQQEKRLMYGENSIKIHLTPIFVLFFREVLSPFYIFQVFSCALWYFDDYVYYASCIVFLSAISIVYSLYSIRQNERALRDIIHHSGTVTVFRRDPMSRQKYIEEEIPSEDIVPGDIIAIKNMSIMQCDAVLLNGNVIVNESMLTGESVPVTKTALSSSRGASFSISQDQFSASKLTQEVKLSIKEHSRHILFSGTQVIQTRYYENEKIKAVVLRTGYSTTKGELVRAILHPKPVDFHFNNDTYKYIGALSFIAFVGMIFSMILKILRKNPAVDIIKRSLDIITIAVPPALPGALTAGLIYAQNRLRKQKIYCISPRTINIVGTINTFVFDKTGTLTEDGLDLKCVLPVKKIKSELGEDIYFGDEIRDVSEFGEKNQLLEAMASCHSITRIHGDLAGDPLDCKMFDFTKWELNEPNQEETENYDSFAPTTVRPKGKRHETENQYEIGIIKQYPFSSSLQRMSVVVRVLGQKNFVMYCKGSPEKIGELSKPESLPKDFQKMLTFFTREGYRVIAVAAKPIELSFVKVQKMEREKLENDLEFLGLIIMENRLKPETCSVISRLKAANIRTIMCTGDNILTALSVARDCDMINEEDRVIIIEANPGEDPKFSYAEIVKQKVKEIEFDPKSKKIFEKDKNSHFHFAVGGKSFDVIRNEHKELLKKLAVRGTVFGRMSPEQKQQLIELLQDLGYFVGMCGDGANDCGALKAANTGISLSNAEASVASPFTSKNPNIECVPTTIREGRAALVTSFGVVKFICMYSLTQFVSVIILYTINAGITDFEFLYIDLFLVTFVAFFFSRTEAFPELYKNPPPNKLIAWRPILSLLGHMLLILGIQVFVFFYVKWQPWFEAYEDSDNKREKNFASYENTAVFTVSMFQYLAEAVIFSKGAPYRRSIFSNYLFMAVLVVLLIFSLILGLVYIEPLYDFFTLLEIPDVKFRFILVGISIVHFFIAFIFESYVIDSDFLVNYDVKEDSLKLDDDNKYKCYPKRGSNQTPYQKIEFEIRKDAAHWPPITSPANHDHNNHAHNNVRSHSEIRETERSLNRSNSNRSHKKHQRDDYEMTTQKVTIVPNENQIENSNVQFTRI
ncbi:unnamed protein product [Brachionus calyciflorus]|uniref:Cation-transporting ATPase n=1 Tax=Brachionus calyciflorus TaxID=104777 RepID=A0A813MAX7_9BILA|nr:unnamed protein product [Brachionus calyciflorus]